MTLLMAQRRINSLLDSVECGDGHSVGQLAGFTFVDLASVAKWLVRTSVPADFESFGLHVVNAFQAERDRPHEVGAERLGSMPPDNGPLVGAITTRVLDLISPDGGESAEEQIRVLLRRRDGSRQRMPPAGLSGHWAELSPPVQRRFLRALDPDLAHIDRIRFRSTLPTAALPQPGLAEARTRWLPQLLWPDWSIRLMPAAGCDSERFRAAAIVFLLTSGNPERNILNVAEVLHPHLQWQLTRYLSTEVTSGGDTILRAIGNISEYLDQHDGRIDYHRRRAVVGTDLLSEDQWRSLCFDTGIHPGDTAKTREQGSGRHLQARRYLHQLLTGADLNDPGNALSWRGSPDRAQYLAFVDWLAPPLRRTLADHAIRILRELGIDEPLTWSPPTDCCPALRRPGREPDDIDRQQVLKLVVTDKTPVGAVAERMATTADHIRLVLELDTDGPWTPAPRGPHVAWRRRQQARELLTTDFFEREHVGLRKRLRQLEQETGFPRGLISEIAAEIGVELLPPWKTAFTIDPHWLRDQYVDQRRSHEDIAAELGTSAETVRRSLIRHKIPRRPPGIASHTQMIAVVPGSVPDDIRRAVEGGLAGWQRLQRFQAVMRYATIDAAAEDLGLFQSALVTQLRRLERDAGAQLFHRAARGKAMRPTARGRALLSALDLPEVQALTPPLDRPALEAIRLHRAAVMGAQPSAGSSG
ncbi:hypothetical protein ABH920_002768 [Catenulispora sp. EB89]